MEQFQEDAVFGEGDAGGSLVVHAGDKAAAFDEGDEAFEFGAHGGFAASHGHFIEMADHEEGGELVAEFHAVDAGLAFEGQDATDAELLEPRHEEGDVAVGVHEQGDIMFLETREQAPVIGGDEFVEGAARDHGPVVVAHVFGDGHEGGDAVFEDLVEETEIELEEVFVDAVEEFGLVAKGEHEFFEAHEGAGEPEEAFEGAPDDSLSPALPLGPGAHALDALGVGGKEVGANAQVIVHVGDDAFDVVLGGFDGGVGGAEPELLVGIEAEVLGDVDDLAELEFAREAFLVPTVNGFIPPHGPLPTGQAVDGLKVHYRAEAVNMRHLFCGHLHQGT